MLELIYSSNNDVRHFVASGILPDALPTDGIRSGSVCFMPDINKKYEFLASAGKWYEQPVSQGKDGKDGYTPQRGVDYWTEEDIAFIENYVDTAIEGGAW